MKKYPKLVQCDKRGQIVIPKDIRRELGIDEGTGFWIYAITDEGILLKKIDSPELTQHDTIINEIKSKSSKIKIDKKNIEKSEKNYQTKTKGNLEII